MVRALLQEPLDIRFQPGKVEIKVFGLTQLESYECTDIEGLGGGFFARVFRAPARR